ncbi:hypothetical protein QBC35DRAFT_298373 [Podospora australis]|uniref:RNA polymerase II subunit A C-terminal domain phosphatase n=1 Tax=Podospora australis TaxID=1536484 RepID=A0AAN7AGD0_9PEZI|nr:hypothetical protein QBC35DRAFT_298373 [Podospora australis]
MGKTVRLGNRLRYPITVVKLLKSPGDKIQGQEAVFEYSYKWKEDIRGNTWDKEQTTCVNWNSPSEGELKSWAIKEGQVIERDGPCMVVEEACSHEVQFNGLCAMCGKDLTTINWAAESRDTDRATISMVHDQTNLTVSESHARKTEEKLQRRLLESRRLSLVVDLDQTVIQACIDPTVGEWMKDPTNPNYDAVKDIKTFQLDDGPNMWARRCWYYIKMRPGLEEFLKRMATMYEMHVYTMGTRAYAQNVAHQIDPDKKLFGDRVISRDENGSVHTKRLQRLFPVSTNMVVIIDDRSDVWPHNRPNLIKVSPYEFFKGIGDINASFLPKRQDLLTSSATTNGVAKKKPTAGATAARAASEGEVTQEQLEEQADALMKQIQERPLQALQEKLDREDEEAEKATVVSEDGSVSRSSSPSSARHRVLYDDDEELRFLEDHLTKVHKEFYKAYDKQAAQRENHWVFNSEIPDVGHILDNLKSQVLKDHKIALSGVLPQNVDIYRSDIGMQLMSFGAELRASVTRDLTHLVVNAAQPGKEKLRAARALPNVKIVDLGWLAECFLKWEAADETPFLYKIRHEGDDLRLPPGATSDVSDEEDIANGANGPKTPANKKRPGLRLTATTRDDVDTDGGEDIENLLPDDIEDGQMSPIDGLKGFNWGSADAELDEFLADLSSDDEDEDMDEEDDDDDDEYIQKQEESSSSEDQKPKRRSRSRTASPSRRSASPANKKRKHDANEDGADVTGTDSERSESGSPSKKLRRTKSARGSSLRNQFVASADDAAVNSSSLPTPAVTGDEEDVALLKGGDDEEEDDGWDEAALEAEFEAGFAAAEEQLEQENNASIAAGGDQEKG